MPFTEETEKERGWSGVGLRSGRLEPPVVPTPAVR